MTVSPTAPSLTGTQLSSARSAQKKDGNRRDLTAPPHCVCAGGPHGGRAAGWMVLRKPRAVRAVEFGRRVLAPAVAGSAAELAGLAPRCGGGVAHFLGSAAVVRVDSCTGKQFLC